MPERFSSGDECCEALFGPRRRCLAGWFLRRHINHNDAIRRNETLARYGVEIVQRHAIDFVQHLVDVVGIVEEGPAFGETICPSAESASRLQSIDELEALRRARPIELRLREAGGSSQLRQQRTLQRVRIASRLAAGDEDEQV